MKSDQVLQGFTQSGLEYLQGWRVKNDRCSCGTQDCYISRFSHPHSGFLMLETSLTSKQEQKKEVLSDCPCSRTGRKGRKEWDRVYFSMNLIMCVREDWETHQRTANVVKVNVCFWDTKFQIPGLNQQNKEPPCLSYTSAISFLIVTLSYHSVSKSVSQIFKERTLKYLGLYCIQATYLKLLTPMGLYNCNDHCAHGTFFPKSTCYAENYPAWLRKFLIQFNSGIKFQFYCWV